MSKFNRRFNKTCQRVSFWRGLELHFQGFQNLLLQPATLTDADKNALKNILALLRECKELATDFRKIHEQKLHALRKELANER